MRFALLKSTVAAIGVFAWRVTREGSGEGTPGLIWRGLGYLTLVVCVAFLYAFVPAPLVIMVWAFALVGRELRAPTAPA